MYKNEYKMTNLALDLEKKLKCYEQKIPKENKKYIFGEQKNLDLLNILLNLTSDDIEQRIEEFNDKYIEERKYYDLVIKNEKLIYQTNEITGLASELFDRLYNLNMNTSFKEFTNILINKIALSSNELHWFRMSFRNKNAKNYFLDEATKYIIENPYSQQEFIDTIKNINTKKDSRFSSIMYLDKDNIPKRFDNLSEMYQWFTIKKANNYLHLFGSKFTKNLLDIIIDYESFNLNNKQLSKRINQILEKCNNDPIIMDEILRSFNININLNIYLLTQAQYTQFALLNILKNNEKIKHIEYKDYDYGKEWQEIIIKQTVSIYFMHYSNNNFEKISIFDVLNHLAYYGFQGREDNQYLLALDYILDKFENFYIQWSYNKEFYFNTVINELVDKQIELIESNNTFNAKDYFLMSWYLEKLNIKQKIYDDTNFKDLIQKIINSIELNIKEVFSYNKSKRNFYIINEQLEKINFSLFYSLSQNKSNWLELIDIRKIKSIKDNNEHFQIVNLTKSYFSILLDIYRNHLNDKVLEKYIIELAITLGVQEKFGILNYYDDNTLVFKFYEVLNHITDKLFNKFIDEVFKNLEIKQILQIYSHTTVDNRITKIGKKIEPLLEKEHDFSWFQEIRETILVSYSLKLNTFAEKLIAKYEDYLLKKKDKDSSELKYIKCKTEILNIYQNKELSQQDKLEKLNTLETKKCFNINYHTEKKFLQQCIEYGEFIRALIFFDNEPIKTYILLRELFEKKNNKLYLFNMLSAYFEAYKDDTYKVEKFTFILNEFEKQIDEFISIDKNLFYLQILSYGYNQTNNHIKLDALYMIAPNYHKEKLKNYLPNTVILFGKEIHCRNKLLICVEGENDINFLKNINNIEELRNIIDIRTFKNIEIHELGGGKLEKFVKEYKLKGTNIVELHIYDSDKGSGKNENKYEKQLNQIKNRNDKSFCFITEKRELENYIPKKLIENEFKIDMSEIKDKDWDKMDIPSFLMGKTKFKNLKKEELEIKKILNGVISKKITKKDLEELNAFNEIKSWFEKIKELSSF